MSTNKIVCAGCRVVIEDSRFLSCGSCKQCYDLVCANVSESRFYNTMTSDHKATWRCVECKSRVPKRDNTNTPVRQVVEGVTMHRGGASKSPLSMDVSFPDYANDTAQNITLDVADFQALVMEMRAFREEMRDELRANRAQINTIIESISTLSGKVTECEQRLSKFEDRLNILECGIDRGAAEQDRPILASIEQLKAELNDRDQELLLNDLEISCIPEVKGESLPHIISTLASKLGVNLVEHDVVSAVRMGRVLGTTDGSAASRPRHIVVRLARRAIRDRLLQAARVRRGATTEGMGLPGPPRRFYVNERLTKVNRHLFRRIREHARRLNWRFVWTKDGRIFVRQAHGSDFPRIRLRSEVDVHRVFGPDDVGST